MKNDTNIHAPIPINAGVHRDLNLSLGNEFLCRAGESRNAVKSHFYKSLSNTFKLEARDPGGCMSSFLHNLPELVKRRNGPKGSAELSHTIDTLMEDYTALSNFQKRIHWHNIVEPAELAQSRMSTLQGGMLLMNFTRGLAAVNTDMYTRKKALEACEDASVYIQGRMQSLVEDNPDLTTYTL